MQYRTLGRTGLEVSALGLGTVELGQPWGIEVPGEFGMPSEDAALALLRRAIELGVNFLDTARVYKQSEPRIGAFLRELGPDASRVYVATKLPLARKKGPAAMREEMRAALGRSLAALGREPIDLVQIHSAKVEDVKAGDAWEELDRAREAGKVRFIGASFYDNEAARLALESGAYDAIQPTYNLAMPEAADVISLANEKGVGVIVKSPLNKGTFSYKREHLADSLAPTREAGDALAFLEREGQSFPQAALRYVLAHPGVSTAIAGTQRAAHLEENVRALEGALTGEELGRIAELQKSGAFEGVAIP